MVNTFKTNLTADLKVSEQKIEYVYYVSDDFRSLNVDLLKSNAVSKALKENGNADVLVSPQYIISKKDGKVIQIRVTGYPATYTNFTNVKE